MKKMLLPVLIFCLAASMVPAPSPAVMTGAEALKTLRPEHPRFYVLDQDLERIRGLIATDPDARALYQRLAAEAQSILAQPMVDFEAPDYRSNIVKTKVLLDKSKEVLRRLQVLLTIWRLDGNREYLERARAEALAAAALDSWNPWHFLDIGEMTHAVAFGYDWMYHELSENDRRTLREAIIRNSLTEARKIYRYGWLTGYGFWNVANHNHNQVNNGGVSIGALAIASEEPEWAEYILTESLQSIRLPMAEFAPDGAWAEGPMVWNYAVLYNVYFLAALDTALGHDDGLSESPGFSRTGDFRMHTLGPTLLYFNFGDAPAEPLPADQMFWLARRFGQPMYAWHERQFLADAGPAALWWFDPSEPAEPPPLDANFRNADIACFRSAWMDENALYLAFKGGDNAANHSHLDLGSFVLDAQGVRWAHDLGKDSYKLPLYFDDRIGFRWRYFRLVNASHNTITIDGKNQDPKAKAPIVKFGSAPERAFAVADLTAAYGWKIKRAMRGVAMLGRSRVVVRDEIEARVPVDADWNFFTAAEIELNGREATLRQNGKFLRARIVEPADAVFTMVSAEREPPESRNAGMKSLSVRLVKVKSAGIEVELTPYETGLLAATPPMTELTPSKPLDEW